MRADLGWSEHTFTQDGVLRVLSLLPPCFKNGVSTFFACKLFCALLLSSGVFEAHLLFQRWSSCHFLEDIFLAFQVKNGPHSPVGTCVTVLIAFFLCLLVSTLSMMSPPTRPFYSWGQDLSWSWSSMGVASVGSRSGSQVTQVFRGVFLSAHR